MEHKPIYATLTIKAAKLAQEGKIKEAADVMAESTGTDKNKQPDVANLFVQYMEGTLHKNQVKNEAFMENMFQEMLGTILEVL